MAVPPLVLSTPSPVFIFTVHVLHLSEIEAAGRFTAAVQLLDPVLTVISAIGAITGASLSLISMVCTHV